ncbi:ABC transporter substrate-binding protein [Streptomyces sp. NPDC052040]|uniref:ABC transporter substrate-binding protein n=1 Tax=unclassified Streptomyces TaxID=2593676 RepID=UPI0037D462FD
MINAKIAAAVLCGYLLGRTKKAKLALSIGAMLAGSKVKPDQLGKLLADSPLLGNVSEQVRTELAGAGKAAATNLLTAKAESLADALHERTSGLKDRTQGAAGADRDEEPEDEEPEDDEDEREEDEREQRRGAARGTGTRRRGADREAEPRRKTAAPTKKTAAKKTAAKKAPARKAPAKKAAQSRTKSGSARSRRPDDG